ncbi:MAG: type I methionyl aminopeptidase [Candidatus Saccharimonadales bacterium]
MYTRVKTDVEIEAMRQSGRMLATVLQLLTQNVAEGISTKKLSDIAAKEITSLGGQAAFLGYQGFPEAICISVNDEVVHGIPRPDTIIKNGDIVSLDLGVSYKGMITDSAVSVICGSNQPDYKPNARIRDLVRYTEASLHEGLAAIKDGCTTGDIGFAVEKVLNKNKFGIVRDLVGHGVGHAVHEDPNIPNYGRRNTGDKLVAGMTVAIEPMATLGREAISLDDDGWTIRTQDGSMAAHFEHTVLVTKTGCEILTQC